MRITFEDHGQDFLTWQLDNNGVATDTLPIDDDELPPWLGQRMRDATHHIHRAAAEAAQEQDTAND
jgi:hypothetical protein